MGVRLQAPAAPPRRSPRNTLKLVHVRLVLLPACDLNHYAPPPTPRTDGTPFETVSRRPRPTPISAPDFGVSRRRVSVTDPGAAHIFAPRLRPATIRNTTPFESSQHTAEPFERLRATTAATNSHSFNPHASRQHRHESPPSQRQQFAPPPPATSIRSFATYFAPPPPPPPRPAQNPCPRNSPLSRRQL